MLRKVACNIGAGEYTASGVIFTIDLTQPQGKIK